MCVRVRVPRRYNLMTAAMARRKRIDWMFQWRDKMREHGFALYPTTVVSMLRTCHKKRRPDKAIEVFVEVQPHEASMQVFHVMLEVLGSRPDDGIQVTSRGTLPHRSTPAAAAAAAAPPQQHHHHRRRNAALRCVGRAPECQAKPDDDKNLRVSEPHEDNHLSKNVSEGWASRCRAPMQMHMPMPCCLLLLPGKPACLRHM